MTKEPTQSYGRKSETVEVHVQEMDDSESIDKMRLLTSANVLSDSKGDNHHIRMPASN